MVRIRVVYSEEPNFGPKEQHPDCERYRVGEWVVDAIGGEPTEQQVRDLLDGRQPPPEVEALGT